MNQRKWHVTTSLRRAWETLRTSYWFVPGGLVILSIASAYLALWADSIWGKDFVEWVPSLKNASADGVRSLLSTVATSVLALAGVTFSATMVALTLASGQFGARLLRNFIREVPNQVTLGVLLGNFVLCLIVLRSVRGDADAASIPHIGASLAFASTLLNLAMFIYFIHNLALSLQADEIVRKVFTELEESIDRFFPDDQACEDEDAEAEEEHRRWDEIERDKTVLASSRDGYLQAIDTESLVDAGEQQNVTCRVLKRPGQFVNQGMTLMTIKGGAITGDTSAEWLDHLVIGSKRNAIQDFEYCLLQLVEIALRALSPGINDPFTAITCIDYIGAAMAKVASRRLPQQDFKDSSGNLRLISRPSTFSSTLDTAFRQLRQTGGDRLDISVRLLEALQMIASAAPSQRRKDFVRAHGQNIYATIIETCRDCDRASVDAQWHTLKKQTSPAISAD